MAGKKMYTGTVRMANGKRKYIRAVSKEEFDRKMQQARLDAGAGVDLTDNTTFGEFAQLWYDTFEKPYLRDTSATDQLYILNSHIMPTFSAMLLRSIKPLHVRQLMGSKQKYSQSVQRKILRTVRSIFAAAVENGLIPSSPVPASLTAGGAPAEEEIPLTTDQSKRLLHALAGTRAQVAVALMLGAGLRREEVCGLMWEDVNLQRGEISVRHAKPFTGGNNTVTTKLKSRAAYRTIPLPEWLVGILKAEKRVANSAFVLAMRNGESLTLSSWQRLWDLIDARTTENPELLGKPVSPKHPHVRYELDFHCHPHQLRHTCATRWIEAGLTPKEVQYLLGHSTPDMTMRRYAHYDLAGQAECTSAKIKKSAVLAGVGA